MNSFKVLMAGLNKENVLTCICLRGSACDAGIYSSREKVSVRGTVCRESED